MLSLICAWRNGWLDNREAGRFETPSRSLWRHCNDATVMMQGIPMKLTSSPDDRVQPIFICILDYEIWVTVSTIMPRIEIVWYWSPWRKQIRRRMDERTHYNDFTMKAMASQITSLTIVYSTVYSGADQRKHQISASLAFVRGIHRPVNSPHKRPVTRKCFHLMTSSCEGKFFLGRLPFAIT